MIDETDGYSILVYILESDKRVDGVVVQEWYQWHPVGLPRPTLDQAKAVLEALRKHPLYLKCKMRIEHKGITFLEVEPGDGPVAEFG